jgi:putative FmdB family regulatory protein
MPMYEYKCPKCRTLVEILQKMDDPKIPQCRECVVEMQRVISKCTFTLIGGGWAKDGYGS